MVTIRRLVVVFAAVVMGTLLPAFGATASAQAAASGPYYVHSRADLGQVFDDRANQGTDLWTYRFHGGRNQQWILREYRPGIVAISPVSNQDKVIAAIQPGGVLVLQRYHDGDGRQLWQVHPLGDRDVVFESIAFRDQAITYLRSNGPAGLRKFERTAAQVWQVDGVS